MFVSALVLAGCPPKPVARPTATGPADALRVAERVRLLEDGSATNASLRAAIDESLLWLAAQPADRAFVLGPRTVTAAQQADGLRRVLSLLADDPLPSVLAARLAAEFDVLEAAGGDDGTVLFTGYYEPLIEASLTREPGYDVPILGRPDDLVDVPLSLFGERFAGERGLFGRLDGKRVVPYWTRAEIDAGKLAPKELEIGWARDPVELFFVEVQGSGTLRLPDGTTRRIGYAASNGRPYRSIGSLLIEEKALVRETVSMQSLKAWLAAHPSERTRVLHFNESYVFFRLLDTAAVGNLGRPVTPGRSIATDQKMFPPGALAFIETERPLSPTEWVPLRRLVLNQDTGGAIRGAGRVDVFWGQGEDAALAAGLMKQKGRLFFLVPKSGSVGREPPP